jgi:glycosyltransferase involved in cell wall biosynthesis
MASIRSLETLKILLVSTAELPVPPPTYGGLERVLFDLAVELAGRGHEISVAATKGSRLPSNIKLIETVEPKIGVHHDWLQEERNAYEIWKKKAGDFDLIHGNNWFGYEYLYKMEHPEAKICHTHHGHLGFNTPPPVQYANFIAISNFMALEYSAALGIVSRFVYNGIDLNLYPFSPERGDRLIYVGRFAKYKQPHVAMDVARRLRIGLDLIGGERFVEDIGYVYRLQDSCDGKLIRWIGEVPHDIKLKYLQKAKALLFPSHMGEPFGLVACEAMACGVPVIALRDGAIPEVVEDGKTGFVCDSVEDMVEAVRKIDSIKPEACRERVEKHFSRAEMGNSYSSLYSSILSGNEW